MTSSLNKAILIGNVGQDPEVKMMLSGDEVVNLSLATTETWKDKTSGEQKSKTEWHKIVVFSKGLVSLIKTYVKKGDKLYIEGNIQTNKWEDKEGQKKSSTSIVLNNFGSKLLMLSSQDNSSVTSSVDADVINTNGSNAPF